jgi:hypothetical protein
MQNYSRYDEHCVAVLWNNRRAAQVAAEQLILMTGVDASLVPMAASYMRIRALAQPAVLTIMVCQGGLLAQQVRVCDA